MNSILLIIFFVLGLIIGSFLNVVILRYNTKKSLGGESACMSCSSKLSWYELIPLFSFIMLRGRCSMCKTKISIQYPLVEFFTGVIFIGLWWKFSTLGGYILSEGNLFYTDTLVFVFTYAYFAIIFSILLVIAVYDIRHKIIPDILVFIFGAFAFSGMFFFEHSLFTGMFYPHIPSIVEFLGSFVVALPFALIWFISRGAWMGLGDAKLALGLGFLLGFSKLLSATLLAFWFGAIVGIFLIIIRAIRGLKSEIPFAPFLVLGAFLVFLFNLNIFSIF